MLVPPKKQMEMTLMNKHMVFLVLLIMTKVNYLITQLHHCSYDHLHKLADVYVLSICLMRRSL